MWLLFGIAAVITAALNIVWTAKHRDAKWFRFLSLSCTAFTLCAFLSQASNWTLAEDWSALADALPGTAGTLWFLTGASVVLNSISLFQTHDR